jgi:alpha/beta superfamily hydrolase
MEKPNRKRRVQIIIRVTEEEKELIQRKMRMLHTNNMAAYARKMLIDGYIIAVDNSDIKYHAAQLQKIGVNINQIAKRLNETGRFYEQDIEEIKKMLHEIWLLERQLIMKAT